VKDQSSTKEQLVNELRKMRERLAKLEASETERKRAEAESETLARIGIRLAGAATVGSMMTVVGEETDHLLGWDSHYFAVRRPEEDTFHVVSFVDIVDGKKRTFPKENWPAADLSPPTQQLFEGRPVLINRTPGDSKPILRRFGNKDRISASLMYAPVRSGDSVIGILCTQSYTYNRYDEADLQTLQRIADAIAPALERAHAEESLRESEQRFRQLYDEAPVGYHEIDTEGNILRVNRTECDLLGYAREEMLGRPVFDFLVAEEREEARRVLKLNIKKRRRLGTFEQTLLTQDARQIPVAIQDRLILDNQGRVMGIRSTVLDMTERKRAEEKLTQSIKTLKRTLEETVNALASTIETRDRYTAGHQRRVTQLACAIAKGMGLSNDQIDGIRVAGSLHDIGKMHVPADILTKPGRLLDMEMDLIKMHPRVAYEILKEIEFPWPVAQAVLQHHERMDGSGYPQGLSGDDILVEARILAVADVVEAISSHRPYRPAIGLDTALEEISQKKGTLYDSRVVDACRRRLVNKAFSSEKEPD